MSLSRKTPLSRGSFSPLKRSPMPKMSAKRKVEVREYSKLVKRLLFERPLCELWLAENGWKQTQFGPELWFYEKLSEGNMVDCGGVAHLELMGAPHSAECHHRLKRGRNYLNYDSFMALSTENHKRVEDNKRWARANGFLA